ncbi:integral membrane amino acid permease [Cryptosporidium sp. chipmunk genotype I]|uniref:integral membrane amino acid permease n=1 Tax=Cryptosporidium sp. chipmunk genotype I TaxID=1280935 RepID=UPI00351A0ADD|nr:integral membrane amino acid permease [Cryptosporidium sp. chipmunk genotype I]
MESNGINSNHRKWAKKRWMPWITMVFTSFFTVSGGSYGSEVVLPVIGLRNFTLIQICICIFYAIPLILIYEMLNKSFPPNSGPKSWCESIFNPFSATFLDILYIFMEIGMLSSYVGVASAYIHSFSRSLKYGALSTGSQLSISVIVFLLIIAVSLLLTYFDDYIIWVFTVVVAPLVIMVILTFWSIPINSWGTIPDLPKKNQLDWITGLQYVMWLNCGYERSFSPNSKASKSQLTSDRDFKLCLIANAVLVSILYILPLWCGCCILNHFNRDGRSFQLGNFFTFSGFLVGGNILSSMITISACFSSIGCITSDVGLVSQFLIAQWCRIKNIKNDSSSFFQETLVSLGIVMFCSFLTVLISQEHFAAGASTLYGFITLITVIAYLKFLWTIDSKESFPDSEFLLINNENITKPSHILLLNSLYYSKLPLRAKQIIHSTLAIPAIFFTLIIFFTTSSILYLTIIILALFTTPIFVPKYNKDHNIKNSKIETSRKFQAALNLL